MIRIREGKAVKSLYATDEWFIRKYGDVIRQLRPTEQPHIKEIWVGSVNGMSKVGTFEVATDVRSSHSMATFDSCAHLFPIAAYEFGIFFTEYVNHITEPTGKYYESNVGVELE
jgi:hypothetical protein